MLTIKYKSLGRAGKNGENVGLLTRHKIVRKSVFGAVCGLALTLGACAGVEETAAKEGSTNPPTELSAENFTTEGKPTKTIVTPWGPKEIYDPVQDTDVLNLVNRIFRSNDVDTYIRQSESQNSTKEQQLLITAIYEQREDLAEAGCRRITESECGTFWEVKKNTEVEKTEIEFIRSASNNFPTCKRNDTMVYHRSMHPIGGNFFKNYIHSYDQNQVKPDYIIGLLSKPYSLSLSEQVQNLFFIHCLNWNQKEY